MKRLLVCFPIVFLVFVVKSQKTQLFLKGGLNISKFSSISIDNFSEVNSVISFNAGVLAKFPLGKKVALQPALQLSGKGAKTKGGEAPFTSHYFNATTRPTYLELPVNIVFSVPLPKNSSLFFGAGFYAALGIGGKNEIDGKTGSAIPFSDEKKINFGKSENAPVDFHNWAGIGNMAKEDYGFTTTAGIHLKKLLFSLDYGYGLKNITRGTRSVKDENKNRVLSLSIGHQLF